MRIQHLSCSTDRPLGGRMFDGHSRGLTGRLVCHCLLIETDDAGLVLVDTAYGVRDVRTPHQRPAPRITRTMRTLLNIQLREEDTALRQVEALGVHAEDVRHILLTHLDFDHAGGLEDFLGAAVHLMDREFDAATARRESRGSDSSASEPCMTCRPK